ncbi:MAG: DNA polymerase III subunit gamma/tau, partial [Acidobacteriota bacterium]
MTSEENREKDSEYQVIARKWRPQGFKDIVGQAHITRTLQNSLRSGRIAHAFLFSGLRGVGKTTTARILAKALNCHVAISSEPCDKCPSCLEIRAGNSVDVQEIDGASNRGIDSIRELRESVRYGTSRDRFKIFIIDEVHMLTKEAFNGLLKTLEEPPGHVKFIMATTEFYKIPPTIHSRCQKYEFKPISPEAILNHLRFVTREEGIEISDLSLMAITSLAQGSMRDAQSSLDQVISFCGKKAQDEDVKALLGVVDFKAVFEVFEAVIDQDGKRVLEVYRDLVLKGVETDILCREMMEHVRNLMVIKVAGWNERLLQLAESGKDNLEKCAARTSEQDLVRFYNLLEQTATELRRVSHPEIHLEMSLLKMVQLARLPKL